MGTLWNTYAFFVLYADIDGFDPTKYNLDECKLTVMDRWILSGLMSLIDFVDQSLAEYKIFESSRKFRTSWTNSPTGTSAADAKDTGEAK